MSAPPANYPKPRNNHRGEHAELYNIPYFILFLEKPNDFFLRVYGCKAFSPTRTAQRQEKKLQKLDPKAW